MRRIFRHRPSPAMAVAFSALLVALGGVAVASLPGPGGVVKACYSKSTGSLRVIDSKKNCSHRRERTLSWNQLGPRGFRGLQGSQGPVGAHGLQGPPGPTFGAVALNGQGASLTDPPANPDESSSTVTMLGRHFDFTLPAAGKAYLRYFTSFIGQDCSAGNGNAGLYLDGNPVPNTGRTVPSSASSRTEEFVVVAAAGAGPHSAEIRKDCPNGNLGSGGEDAHATWTVLLLGG